MIAVWVVGLISVLFVRKTALKLDLLGKVVPVYVGGMLVANLGGLDPQTSIIGTEWRHQGYIFLIGCYILYLLTTIEVQKSTRFFSLSVVVLGSVNFLSIGVTCGDLS